MSSESITDRSNTTRGEAEAADPKSNDKTPQQQYRYLLRQEMAGMLLSPLGKYNVPDYDQLRVLEVGRERGRTHSIERLEVLETAAAAALSAEGIMPPPEDPEPNPVAILSDRQIMMPPAELTTEIHQPAA